MGGAREHALKWGVAAITVVSALVVLPSAPAAAVSPGRPIAVAVGADATSYVGFASGGRLLRLDAAGEVDGSVPLDESGPVDGLAVDEDGDIWVDYGDSVSELDPDGTLLTHFEHQPALTCPADHAHDPARYGGLAVTSTRVYVAGRCRASLEVYSLSGVLRASVNLPGTDLPRGVAVAPSYAGLPSRVYVTLPDAGDVVVYNRTALEGDGRPVRTLHVQRGGGFAKPQPAAVVADESGQLAVLDVANNAIYFYNAKQDYGFYRTLGHPPEPDSLKGRLDHPRALAQMPGQGRNLWVADTGNGRVQRWRVDGTTEWMANAEAPGVPGAPEVDAAPVVTGTRAVGEVLSCSNGSWSGSPTGYTRVWQRDGVTIDGETDPTYVVRDADAGHEISCVVTATNEAGASGPASSAGVTIPGSDPDPDPSTTCRGRPTVRILGEKKYAHDPFVELAIRAPAGATAVTISNDADFERADTKPLTRSCRYRWTLEHGSSADPKVVHVRFPGALSAGRATDSIVLDSAAPRLHKVTAKWENSRWGWVVRIRASDRGTGLASVTYGRTRSNTETVGWPADIVSWDASWIRWFRVRDEAGNLSAWYKLNL